MAMNIALWNTTDKTLDQNKLVWLQNEANKYWGISNDNFKNYVNNNYWQGAYDVLKQWVINTWLQSQNQTNVSTAQKLATPAQTQQPASSWLEWVKWYDASQVWIPWVNLASPSTPTPPTSPTIEPDYTKPHWTWDVWDSTQWVWKIPWTQTWQTNIDDIVNNMFPKWTYSEDERNAMKQMLQSKNPSEIASIMAEQAKGNYTQSKNLLNAYRTTRDFWLSQQRLQTLNDQKVQDLTQQYDNAITSQKQRMEADANNMAMVQGTSWRLQSRNMMNWINQILDTNKNIYNQLVSNKDRDIQRLAQDLEYAQKIASNEYNDMVNQEMQDMLKWIQALDSSWSLATAQWLVQARDFIDKTISNNMQHQADYYNKLWFIAQRFDAYHKEALQASTIDDSVTKTMWDGYLYNAQWMRVKDENWQPLRVAWSTQGTLLTKEPIVLNDWSKAFVYQNPDWTMRTEKIVGTEAKQIDQNTISKYAQALSTGLLDIWDLQKMWVSNADINNIVAQTNWKVETMTPYQQAQTELEKQKLALEQQKFDALNWVVTWATTWGKVPDISITSTWWRAKNWPVQCWEFVNDLADKYWVSTKLWNSYQSKINALNKIWLSNEAQPWSIFVLNTWTSTWHTWIIQSVNPDWSFVVQEANKSWSKQWGEPTLWTYKSSAWMTFSRPVILDKWENTNAEITTYNSATPTQQAKLKNNASYNDFINKKQEIMADPDALMQDIMKYSQWWKDMDSETAKSLWKFWQALWQVESLQANIKKISTWPLIWRLKEFNPYSSEWQALKAEINSLIPNLARWVYGEVWVLTDNDIINYAKTVPNLKSTNDVNNLVLAMTLKTMMNGYKNILQTQASAWRDVSGFQWQYKRYEDKINKLLWGQNKTESTQFTAQSWKVYKIVINPNK